MYIVYSMFVVLNNTLCIGPFSAFSVCSLKNVNIHVPLKNNESQALAIT